MKLEPNSLQCFFSGTLGIEGKDNSCYIDSTVTAIFAFSNIFDTALNDTCNIDSPGGRGRQVLKNLIVNPMREFINVHSSCVTILREVLLPIKPEITGQIMGDLIMFVLF
jgi:hypothetical protein